MRISDWSSDVCSSDLDAEALRYIDDQHHHEDKDDGILIERHGRFRAARADRRPIATIGTNRKRKRSIAISTLGPRADARTKRRLHPLVGTKRLRPPAVRRLAQRMRRSA